MPKKMAKKKKIKCINEIYILNILFLIFLDKVGPTSGGVVVLKTVRREVPDSTPVALVDLAVWSFPWFSLKLA